MVLVIVQPPIVDVKVFGGAKVPLGSARASGSPE